MSCRSSLQYAGKEFGTCPLVQCGGQPVLPVGLKDEIGADTVKIFCPKCTSVYHPPPVRSRSNHQNHVGSSGNAGVDGASFGTTFPHLFLMTFSNLVPDPLPGGSSYIPRVFGFRVHQSARQAHSAAAASPTQMIVIRRDGEGDEGKTRNGDDNQGQGRSRNLDGDGNKRAHPPQFTTSKLHRHDSANAKRSNRYSASATAPAPAVNGKEGDETQDKKRKLETSKGDGEKDNGGNDISSKRRKRPEKET